MYCLNTYMKQRCHQMLSLDFFLKQRTINFAITVKINHHLNTRIFVQEDGSREVLWGNQKAKEEREIWDVPKDSESIWEDTLAWEQSLLWLEKYKYRSTCMHTSGMYELKILCNLCKSSSVLCLVLNSWRWIWELNSKLRKSKYC